MEGLETADIHKTNIIPDGMKNIEMIFPSLKTQDIPKGVHWNNFRKIYDDLSFKERAIMSDYVDKMYPKQGYYKRHRFKAMFEKISDGSVVLELGCHDGGLAKYILSEFPNIGSWLGYDFPGPLKRSVVEDSRYSSMELDKWFHEIELPDFDVFVAAHTLEHLSNDQCLDVLLHINGVKYILIEVPLNEEGRTWHNWGCGHVLTWGLKKLYDLMEAFKYTVLYEFRPSGSFAWTKQ